MTDADMAAEIERECLQSEKEKMNEYNWGLQFTFLSTGPQASYMHFTVPLYDDPAIKIPPLWVIVTMIMLVDFSKYL